MRIILQLFLATLCFFIGIQSVFTHPLDISVSTLNIKKNTASINTYLHTYEVEYLLQKHGIVPDGVDDYYTYQNIILDYYKNKVIFENNSAICQLKNLELIRQEAYLILTDGLEISSDIICSEKIKNFELALNLFLEFPLQTNRVVVYDLQNQKKNITPILSKVLTVKIPNFQFTTGKTAEKQIDSDNDGISDDEEAIYGTRTDLADTDGDFYSDKQEVEYGWDPLNPELWPGQTLRVASDLEVSQETNFSSEYLVDKQVRNANLSDYGTGNAFLKDVMKRVNDFFTKQEGNLLWILVFIFFLWMLHTLWPWHSKSLLAAYTLEKQNGYRKGIAYAAIFTITHIIDIVILFLLVKWLSGYVDIWAYNFYIQIGAAWLLLALWSYLLYRAIKRKKCSHTQPQKASLWLAFLSGLAPCSFAWSLFLLLGAIGKTNFIFLFLIALGLWIFATLVGIVLITVFFKEKIYKKSQAIADYSVIASAGLIMAIAIFMLSKLMF